MFTKSKKKKTEVVGVSLIDSLKISENFYNKQENRLQTLLLKGLIVYLVTAGMIGSALTATSTYFNQIIFNIIVALLSVLISLIYYNKTTENIGDILYLFGIIFFGVILGAYINSGFYAWMNDIVGTASVYFDLPDIGGYNQVISNSDLTVTIASCYLGAIAVILINMSIAKRMMYGDLFLDALIVLLLPLYFELEPKYVYFIMFCIGVIFAAIWKNTGKYTKVDNNSVYIRTKKCITYTYNFKAHLYTFLQIGVVVITVFALIYVVYPYSLYSLDRKQSESKNTTDEYVETFITSGIQGFFNRYDNIGGMSSGRLGGVSSIRLDYRTDLNITFAPYNYKPVYLRTFVGGDYRPYDNSWSVANKDFVRRDEYTSLKKQYDNKNKYSSKATLLIENIESEIGEYALYYTDKDSVVKRSEIATRIIYPANENIGEYNNENSLSDEERDYWLTVPNDNVPSIVNTLNIIDIPQDISPLEKADYIKYYYLVNIPYTLRPGTTPYRKDFINYFLDKNKKGYCVHFASAATLMFRYMGIPARYVEGYVYDYSDSEHLTVLNDVNRADYYDGYSEIGDIPVITASLTDADAHAWVEIYTDEYGWVPVELTPPSSDTENVSGPGLLDRFLSMFDSSGELNDSTSASETTVLDIDTKAVRNVIIWIFAVVASFVILYYLIRLFVFVFKYRRSDINSRLIIRYHYWIKKISRRNKLMSDMFNYHDQIEITMAEENDKDKLINIMEKAGFSNKNVTKEEFDFCQNMFKHIKR